MKKFRRVLEKTPKITVLFTYEMRDIFFGLIQGNFKEIFWLIYPTHDSPKRGGDAMQLFRKML